MAEEKKINAIIATDCGSTTTKVILITRTPEGEYRLAGRGEAPTTVEAPFDDVTIGVINAVTELQEITGRKRDSEGRFFVPAFTFAALNDMMVRAFGHFRWALCKTIQGVNWNNIQVRSLTSEYSDYIQFYKKNHDLSDERKEKIKLQIQRGRNNLRQVFTLDYEVWVKAESTGSVRLNKVVRDMLAMYCPFASEIREAVCKQPLFEEAFSRSNRERSKKVHELELRHKALEAKGIEVPEPLVKTLAFYKTM